MIAAFVLALLPLAPRQDVSPADLLRQALAASKENARKSANWLGREDIKRYQLRRKRRLISWVTYEASKVEGENYYRLIARDGKPLSKAEHAREQAKLDREAAYRRTTPLHQRTRTADNRFSMSIAQILEHHDLQYSGEDTVNGRKIWIVDTRVRDAAPMPAKRDDMALAGNTTLWIDQQTKLVVMQELRVTRNWDQWRPGSLVRYELFWNGEVMLVSRILIHLPFAGLENVQTYSEYRKFGAESNVTFESDTSPPPEE